jgi:hypothetical protein
MTLEVHLRDGTNGKTKIHLDVYPDDYPLQTIVFLWTDGNYGCDCNRGLFMYGDTWVHVCGIDRFVVDRAFIREGGAVLCRGLGDDGLEDWSSGLDDA